MRIASGAYRRVNAGSNYIAEQNPNLVFGNLIIIGCEDAPTKMFTSVPAIGEVLGRDIEPITVGGKSEYDLLLAFLGWASSDNITLYNLYKDVDNFDEISIEHIKLWRDATGEPVPVTGSLTITANSDRARVVQNYATSGASITTSCNSERSYGRTGSASISLGSSVSYFIAKVHSKEASTSLSINSSVNYFIAKVYERTANSSITTSSTAEFGKESNFATSALFIIHSNVSTELISSWSSETTLFENLNRNWEAN
jgi:hypothetical protein